MCIRLSKYQEHSCECPCVSVSPNITNIPVNVNVYSSLQISQTFVCSYVRDIPVNFHVYCCFQISWTFDSKKHVDCLLILTKETIGIWPIRNGWQYWQGFWSVETFYGIYSVNMDNWVETKGLMYEGVSKSFRPGRLEREMQMVQLCATRCTCIAVLWVSLLSFTAIALYVVSQRVFIVVSIYFTMDSVRKLLDIPWYSENTRDFSIRRLIYRNMKINWANRHDLHGV
jgi:hypothetical protein